MAGIKSAVAVMTATGFIAGAACAATSAQNFYPPDALNAEVEGSATIQCTVQLDGRLAQCTVLNEDPKGYGFGTATVRLFEATFNANDHPEMGQPHKPGDKVKINFKWKL